MTTRTRSLAAALALVPLAGCLAFTEDGAYACDPKTGKDCSGRLSSSDVRIEDGRFEPVASDVAGGGYEIRGGTLLGSERICNGSSTCVEGGITP